jgi:hypothetical protein
MDSLILFLICLWLIKRACQNKRIGWEDFFEIRWKEQPKLFLTVVFMLCVTAFHSFCHIISIDILRDNLDLIDSIFCFVVCFGALMVFVLEKKSIIWKEHYLERASVYWMCVCGVSSLFIFDIVKENLELMNVFTESCEVAVKNI